jgi:hypothetical protein
MGVVTMQGKCNEISVLYWSYYCLVGACYPAILCYFLQGVNC